jgi:riboflavin kinase/FMN adenylyltransferase
LCLGNFDGVHLGHRALLQAARKWRDARFPGIPVGVFCFRDFPSDTLSDPPVGHLCSLEERLSRFAECGMEIVILASFAELRALSPETYIEQILKETCHCVAAACGFNHRFGRFGKGTPALLEERFGDALLLQEQVTALGEPVSSTRIRGLLQSGKPEQAEALLTHPYSLKASVLHGKAFGRTIGVPTINQNFPVNAVVPRFGVYATEVEVRGERYVGVSNVGIHPTVDADACVNCETFLLNFSGDLYGEEVTVCFRRFLRPEMKFESVEALREQIRQDVCRAAALQEDGTR